MASSKGVGQLVSGLHNADAAAAATVRCLDNHRVVDAAGALNSRAGLLQRGDSVGGTRDCGNTSGVRQLAGTDLVAQLRQLRRARANKDDAAVLARAAQLGALGQKTIAGVDGVDLMGVLREIERFQFEHT